MRLLPKCLVTGLLMLLLLIVTGCDDTTETASLATIGDLVISADDFKYQYAFGFASLKQGQHPKMAYLDYMIKEHLLAAEGYELGFDQSASIQRQRQAMQQELLIETLIDTEIKAKIEVTDDEIRREIERSKVTFNLTVLIRNSLEEARQLQRDLKNKGLDVVLPSAPKNPEEDGLKPFFETGQITYDQVAEELQPAVLQLPIGVWSEPLPFNNQFAVVRVKDLRREGLLDSEYAQKAASFEQVIFYKKMNKALQQYVVNLLQPKKIVTDGGVFSVLLKGLMQWKNIKTAEPFAAFVMASGDAHPDLVKLRSMLSQPLVTHTEGSILLGDFIRAFNFSPYRSDELSRLEVREKLNTDLAHYIRNTFLAEAAVAKGLQDDSAVRHQLQKWTDKWVYEAYRDNQKQHQVLADSVTVKVATQRLNTRLTNLSDSLRNIYPVTIDTTLLIAIDVQDSKKSRWQTTLLFKTGTNRLAYPVPDPAWGIK
jgi:hypothetical protein